MSTDAYGSYGICFHRFSFMFVAFCVDGGDGSIMVGVGEAPKDFTKPRQTIQSHNRLYKAPERL